MWVPLAQPAPDDARALKRGRIPQGEDIFFTLALAILGRSIAPVHVAMQFSSEELYYPTPLAIHKPWVFTTPGQLEHLLGSSEFCKQLTLAGCGMDAYTRNHTQNVGR